MPIVTRLVEYDCEGRTFEGFLAWDDKVVCKRPAVAIAHAWMGRTQFECEKARKLAELGYVGFAVDMYGKGCVATTSEEASKLMEPLVKDRSLLQKRITKAIETLRNQPEVEPAKTAAMGFCFGGMTVLDLARTGSDVCGVVSFHGLLTPPGNALGNLIKAKVLVMHGWDDPMVPPDAVLTFAKEMTESKADWQIHAYGNTMHAFTLPMANDPASGIQYNAAADARSWISLQNFLHEIFSK